MHLQIFLHQKFYVFQLLKICVLRLNQLKITDFNKKNDKNSLEKIN